MKTNFLNNIAISKLLIGVYALLVVVLIVVIVILIRDSNTVMKQYDDIANHSTQKLALMGEIRKGTAYVQVAVLREAILTAQADMDKEEKTIQHESERVQNKLDTYEKLIEEPAERKMFNDVIAARSENAKARNVLKELSTTKKQKAIESQTKYQWILFERYQDALSNLSDYIAKQTIEKGKTADLTTQRVVRKITYELAVAIILLVILGFLIVRASGKIKENEIKLNGQKNYAEGLLQAAPDGMIGINPKGEIILFNKQAERLFGYESKEITGERIEKLMPQRFKAAHEGHVKGYFEAPKVRQMGGSNRDLFGRRKNGEEFPIDISLSYMQLADGKIAIAGIRDITEKKQIENKLAESEELLQQSGAIAKMGGWEINLSDMTVRWTDEVYHIHELEHGRMPTVEEGINYYAPEARPIIAEAVNKAIATGEGWDIELPFITAKGNHLWVRAIGKTKMENGKAIRVFGVFQDITENKKAEENLKTTTAQVQHIFNKLDNSFWASDIVNNKMLYVSPGNEKVYGYPERNFLDNPNFWNEVVVPEDKHIAFDAFSELNKGKSVIFENRIRHADGTIRWIEARITPTLDANGKLSRLDGITIDITERKKAEDKLETQNKELLKTNSELDRFVYSTSHDLRSPLTSVLGLVSFIEDETKEPDTLKHAHMIRARVKRLDDFVTNILNYSRNNRLDIVPELIDFNGIIKQTVDGLKHAHEAKEINFDIKVSDVTPFYTDLPRITAMFENLIGNAIKIFLTRNK